MSFEVHREPLYRRYYASYASGAFCYAICFGFVLIFLPLMIAYNSSSFWIKENVLYEQPTVSYRYQAIVEVFGKMKSTGNPFALYYSSSSILNQQHSNNLRIPVLQTAEIDDNRDGIIDRMEVIMNMPLQPDELVTGMSAVFLHDVKLKTRARYVFDAASLVQFEGSTPISHLRIDGDIKVRQTWPLTVKGGFKAPYSGDSLLSTSPSNAVSETLTSQYAIMSKSAGRNRKSCTVPTCTHRSLAHSLTPPASTSTSCHTQYPPISSPPSCWQTGAPEFPSAPSSSSSTPP